MKKIFIVLFIMEASNIALLAQNIVDRHTTNAHDGWMSCEVSPNPNSQHGSTHWLRYDFGQQYALYDMTLWNINHPEFLADGIKSLIIETSQNGSTWNLVDSITLPRGTGSGFYSGFKGPDLGGINARYMLLTVLETHGGGGCAGLSEMRVFTEDQTTNNLELVISPCENDGIYKSINGGLSLGGTYSGPGVADNGDETFDFDASSVGPGNYTVTYQYNGGSKSSTINVLPCGSGPCPTCPDCDQYDPSTINSSMIPSDIYHGSNVTSMGKVVGSNNVHFKGSEGIELQAGFEVEVSNNFAATINECNVNVLVNSGFEDGQTAWLFDTWDPAEGNLSIVNNESFAGQSSARIDVTTQTDASWQIQFRQVGLDLEAGKTYQVDFAAKAAGGGSFNASVYLDDAPYTGYLNESPNISPYWKNYSFEFTPETAASGVRLTFQFGESPTTSYWIDEVRFLELTTN